MHPGAEGNLDPVTATVELHRTWEEWTAHHCGHGGLSWIVAPGEGTEGPPICVATMKVGDYQLSVFLAIVLVVTCTHQKNPP